jgi:hypothetical protein
MYVVVAFLVVQHFFQLCVDGKIRYGAASESHPYRPVMRRADAWYSTGSKGSRLLHVLRGGNEEDGAVDAEHDWRNTEFGMKIVYENDEGNATEGQGDDEDDDGPLEKGRQYKRIDIPTKAPPDKPPDILAATVWDCLMPSASSIYVTMRLATYGTAVQVRADSRGSLRLAPEGEQGDVFDCSAEGHLTKIWSARERTASITPCTETACVVCRAKQSVENCTVDDAAGNACDYDDINNKKDVADHEGTCAAVLADYLSCWEDGEALHQLRAMPRKMPIKSLPFVQDQYDGKVSWAVCVYVCVCVYVRTYI